MKNNDHKIGQLALRYEYKYLNTVESIKEALKNDEEKTPEFLKNAINRKKLERTQPHIILGFNRGMGIHANYIGSHSFR